jgi:opacity protein-like surface antigen
VSCADGNAPGICGGLFAPNRIPGTDFSAEFQGVIGGGQIGYNFQYANLVFGVETDFDWTNADGSDIRSDNFSGSPQTQGTTEKLDWLGTVRGRLGYASGNLLVYATGGLAYAKVNDTYSYNLAAGLVSASGSSSDTQTGWTIGGGAELAIDRAWSLKGEYLFYSLVVMGSTRRSCLAARVARSPSRRTPMAKLLAWASITASTSREAGTWHEPRS